VYHDYHYTMLVTGFIQCNDARTGERTYGRKRNSRDGAADFTTSPWSYNGKVFVMEESGGTYVVQAGPEFKTIGKNSLDEIPLATPAIVRNSLIIRTVGSVYRIAKPEATAGQR
jgi:outer membrane protein assembly factor BamB